MNRTPRPVVGSRRAAVAAAYARAAEADKARKHTEAIKAMHAVASVKPKPKGPKRDAKGRFVKKTTV